MTIPQIETDLKHLRAQLKAARLNPALLSRDQLRIYRKRRNYLTKLLRRTLLNSPQKPTLDS